MPKKIKPGKKPACEKKKVIKYKVEIASQNRIFSSQNAAREWVLKLLKAPIYFLSMTEVEVEEDDC